VYRADLRSLLPDDEMLDIGLASVFGELRHRERIAHVYASSFPAEIVRCTLADGRRVDVLCKYTAGKDYDTGGHRGGVAYEASVYRSVLGPLGVSTPVFHGDYEDPSSGDHWLFVEFLDAAVRADEADDPAAALRAAARWAGDLQRRFDRAPAGAPAPELTVYTADYYAQWARRTCRFGEGWLSEYGWLPTLCRRFEELAPSFAAPDAVVHGEFTPHNVLVDDAGVHPVDWESAAHAIGEIDVASLIEGWSDGIVGDCITEYQCARWPAGAPERTHERLDFARVYWALRWLGHAPEWRQKAVAMRMKQLHVSGQRLGLV
jgi:hypothetical protein